MFKMIATILLTLTITPVFAGDLSKTEEQKTLYAVGLVVARQLPVFNLTPAE